MSYLPLIIAASSIALIINSKKKKAFTEPGPPPPQPDLEFDEAPDFDGESMPMLGNPYADECLKAVYGGNHRVDQSVLSLMNSRAKAVVTPSDGRWTWVDEHGVVRRFSQGITYLKPIYQVAAFKSAVNDFSVNRQIISLTTRDILKRLMPNCEWDIDIKHTPGVHYQYMNKEQYNLWLSVLHLATAASRQSYKVPYRIGGSSPRGNLLIPDIHRPGLIVGRGYLNMPDLAKPGSFTLEPGRRVELIAADYRRVELPYPHMYYSERLYAYVVGSSGGTPIVEILSTFNNKDVSPKFSRHHGFEVGERIHLNSKITTGIRRIFKSGIV